MRRSICRFCRVEVLRRCALTTTTAIAVMVMGLTGGPGHRVLAGALPSPDAAPAAIPVPLVDQVARHDSAGAPRDSDVVYSNSPDALFPPGAHVRIADDIWITDLCGCTLDAFEFTIGGGGDGSGPGFTVDFGLYDGCPSDGGQLIPGTSGSRALDHNGLHVVSFDYEGAPLETPFPVWLAVKFSTSSAGWLAGTFPEIGFSQDLYDYPSAPCQALFGGTNYYAAFAARVFCERSSPPGVVNPDPPDGAVHVPTNTNLSWNNPLRATGEGSPGSEANVVTPDARERGAPRPGNQADGPGRDN